MLFIVFVVASLGILNTMLMAVFERTRELGVLLAIGISPKRIFGLVMSEAFLLAVISAFFGLLIGGALDFWLIETGIDFSVNGGQGLSYGGIRLSPIIRGKFEWGWVFLILGSLFVVTGLTALWPAIKASRIKPLVAMKEHT